MIQRFFPTKDTFITNAITSGPDVRATGSSLGDSFSLQLFKATSSFPSSGAELARILLQFDFRYLSGLVFQDKLIPASASYVLRMSNYITDRLPSSFDVIVCPASGTFDAGIGIDDNAYTDYGWANWLSASSTAPWINPGGDYYTSPTGSQHFDTGTEDLEIDITPIVRNWLTGAISPDGLLVKLSDACESNQVDYWRKVFYSTKTLYVENVPYIEARWNDVRKDNRGNFAYNQPNALYMYNIVRGTFQDISGLPIVRVQDNWLAISASFKMAFTASRESTGTYALPLSVTGSILFSSSWIDIWQDSNGTLIMTGSFRPQTLIGSDAIDANDYVLDVGNLKRVYRTYETARIAVNVRNNYHTDHIAIHTASLDVSRQYMEDMYYGVVNNQSGKTVIPFGTGSIPYTKLSYNKNGNYFDLNMASFVPGFTYRFIFLINEPAGQPSVFDDKYIFKVL